VAKSGPIQAREDGNAKERRAVLFTGHGFARGPHHGHAARGVQRNQADLGEVRGGFHGASHGVGYVVKLQVQEDPKAQAGQLFHCPGTFGRKKLAADLEQAGSIPELPRQGAGWPQAVNIQGYD
jgi:hypothetical protein